MHPNDIAPYRDRFLVVQYTTDHRSRQGYRYEVGLLDLGREPGIQELGVRTIHYRASPLSLSYLCAPLHCTRGSSTSAASRAGAAPLR
jgi:hypothetical protein